MVIDIRHENCSPTLTAKMNFKGEDQMKKMILFISFFVIVLLSSQTGFSYTINDTVGDRIGNWAFEIYGIDVLKTETNLAISLYTNYPQSGYTVGSWATFVGDLAIDANHDGIYEYGFALTDHNGLSAGQLYNVSEWYTSNFYSPSSGYIYNKDKIVTIKSGTYVGEATSWGWGALSGGPDYKIDINLATALFSGLGEEIGLYWAAATCANDYVEGTAPIPEPATMLLFGSGLIGIAALLRKKVKK